MPVATTPPGSGTRRLLTSLAAQGLASLSNVGVALIVARALGPAQLGRFGALFALLTFFTALQTHWVGDTLTVWWTQTERSRSGGMQLTQLLHMVGAGVASLILCMTWFGLTPVVAVAFAALVFFWQLEEFGRRVLIAGRQYGVQARNEAVYLLGAGVPLALFLRWNRLTFSTAFASMAAGALLASVHAMRWVPHDLRRRPTRDSTKGLLPVARYGGWRAAQGASAALAQVVIRVVVILQLGYGAAGLLEAGRLVVAPLFVGLVAVTNVMLPDLVHHEADGSDDRRPAGLYVAELGLIVGVVGFAAGLAVFGDRAVRLLAGEEFDVPQSLILAWLVVAGVTAYTTRSNLYGMLRLPSRRMFFLRMGGTISSVVLAAAFSAYGALSLVPIALAVGALLAKALISRALSSQVGLPRSSP